MENAAKALSIAGGILIAVMLAVLVYYVFTHWGESQRIKQEDVEVQKVEDFNKSYLSYEKVLYGSELLGLVNKMSDYNISDDVKYSGYSKMNLSMEITDKTTGNLFSNGTYSLSSISNAINTVMNKTVNSSKYKGQISDSQWEYLAKSSTSTKFDDLCTELKIPSSINREQLKADAAEYYKYVQFKRKKFKHIGTEFSNDGRVSKMSFEETN